MCSSNDWIFVCKKKNYCSHNISFTLSDIQKINNVQFSVKKKYITERVDDTGFEVDFLAVFFLSSTISYLVSTIKKK